MYLYRLGSVQYYSCKVQQQNFDIFLKKVKKNIGNYQQFPLRPWNSARGHRMWQSASLYMHIAWGKTNKNTILGRACKAWFSSW